MNKLNVSREIVKHIISKFTHSPLSEVLREAYVEYAVYK